MPIVQQGSINTTALVVPDLYVQIVPPQNLVLNGVPTNVVGVVGTASWGPVGHPVIVATMADYAQSFGPIMARKYDMGTQVATAVQQGAQNFRCIRVTDNTGHRRAGRVPWNTVTFTALHTGSLGNRVDADALTGIQGQHLATDRFAPRTTAGGLRQYCRDWRHFLDRFGQRQ